MTLTCLSDTPPPTVLTYTYRNSTDRIQIIRVATSDGSLLERAVFPGQHLSFAAAPEAQLEIYSGEVIGALLEDRLTCSHLESAAARVGEPDRLPADIGFKCRRMLERQYSGKAFD